MDRKTTTRTRLLVFAAAAITSVVSGFLILMYFHHDAHWTPHRFGGLPVALACIPICALSYGVSAFHVNQWLHPRLLPYLRARIPRPPPEDGKP